MTAVEATGFLLALVVMLLGLVGAVVPGLPGPPLIFAAALAHRIYFGDRGVAWWVVIAMGFLTGGSMVLDFAATSIGARRFGATWRGILGAGLGALFGLFMFPPFGLILGPLVGAVIAELLGGREWKSAGKAGVGALLGLFAGTAAKVAACLAMIVLFALNLLLRSPISGN